jgi:hypothetical protein
MVELGAAADQYLLATPSGGTPRPHVAEDDEHMLDRQPHFRGGALIVATLHELPLFSPEARRVCWSRDP